MKQDQYEEVIACIVKNQDQFYRLAYSYVRNKEDALDIVQNAICKALEHYQTLKNQKAVRTWFYRILVNESISYIRRYGKELQYQETGQLLEEQQAKAYRMSNGGSVGINEEDTCQLYQEISRMPLELQNIIKLHYFENMTLLEVSEILTLNLSSVKAKLYRGLKKLKISMEENDIWEN